MKLTIAPLALPPTGDEVAVAPVVASAGGRPDCSGHEAAHAGGTGATAGRALLAGRPSAASPRRRS